MNLFSDKIFEERIIITFWTKLNMFIKEVNLQS